MNLIISRYILLHLLLLPVISAAAEEPDTGRRCGWRGGRDSGEQCAPPFGDYCPRKHADNYGARQPVNSPEEAKERLARFFNIPPAHISLISERRMGYIATINNPDGSSADRVIIDKRSGRIRSIR